MMFDSLLIRDFRFLWVSNLRASFAMQMEMVARGWCDLPPYNVPSPKVRIWDVERGSYGQETVHS
jgi:hypothetical protein